MEQMSLSEKEYEVLKLLVGAHRIADPSEMTVAHIASAVDMRVNTTRRLLLILYHKRLVTKTASGHYVVSEGGLTVFNELERVEEPAPYDWLVLRRLSDVQNRNCGENSTARALYEGCESLRDRDIRTLRRTLNQLEEVGDVEAVPGRGSATYWRITDKGRSRL